MRFDRVCWTSRLRPPRNPRTSSTMASYSGLLDAADAGRRTALDLVLQAGPCAGREDAIRAGAQRKGALQRVERAVDRGGRRERPEILVGRTARPAVLGELRPFGVATDHDVGERLVVAQQHVEARHEALDQVVLEEQRLGFAVGDGEFHGPRGRDHADQARGEPGWLSVGGHPGCAASAPFRHTELPPSAAIMR